MAKYPILTDEMFNDMMSSDAGIREARYATGYGRWLNGGSVTDGHYVSWPDYRSKWEISDAQREFAMQRFEERKADCGYNGYIIYGGAGCFTEIGRRSGKDAAMEFAKENVRELYLSDVEFKWNPICHRIKLV